MAMIRAAAAALFLVASAEANAQALPPPKLTIVISVDQFAADLFDELVSIRADRHTAVVAVGGGVVGEADRLFRRPCRVIRLGSPPGRRS